MPEYHKGGLCIHQLLICQEGYCNECDIHSKALQLNAIEAPSSRNPSKKQSHKVLVASGK